MDDAKQNQSRSALLVGATGLVGGHVLDALLAQPAYDRVVTLGRRPIEREHERLTHHVIDFDRLVDHADAMAVDDVYCCLGTTRAEAGSREAFRQVDLVYPVRIAELAQDRGARRYALVSALGASETSLFFYNRVKGEVETAVSALPYEAVHLFRPSLLTGERDDPRRGEQVAETVLDAASFLLRGPLRRLRPTPARAVAAAMIAATRHGASGVHVHEPEAIERLAAASA